MDTYLPISKAATITKLDKKSLQALIASGTIRAIKAENQIFVNKNDLSMIPKENRPDYEKYAHLSGIGILISEASRKYGVSTQTISRWAKKGNVKVLSKSVRRTYLDEADIAYLANYYLSNPGRGKKTIRRL